MLTLSIPDDIEHQLNALAFGAKSTPEDIVLELVKNYVKQHQFEINQQHEEDQALQIHEQIMDQYAETFQNLTQ
ncbi:MAG: hypothetical protein Q8Q40_13710 [Methylococcaceae bacterium]|nr:hypothetical protein [Methylococcaceae bacterium]MDP3905014.1 hypothetical protein [Methylococcaceae bacterium]